MATSAPQGLGILPGTQAFPAESPPGWVKAPVSYLLLPGGGGIYSHPRSLGRSHPGAWPAPRAGRTTLVDRHPAVSLHSCLIRLRISKFPKPQWHSVSPSTRMPDYLSTESNQKAQASSRNESIKFSCRPAAMALKVSLDFHGPIKELSNCPCVGKGKLCNAIKS